MELSGLNKNTSVTRTADILPAGSSTYGSLPQTSRTAIYPIKNVQQSAHSTENNSRIFSPYTAPSAINVENRALSQASNGPNYQHNIAMTKYYHVSMPPKPRMNQSMNILA